MSPPGEKIRRRARRALVGLGSVVLALVIAEGVLRALALPRVEHWLPGGENAEDVLVVDPDLFWRLAPDGQKYLVNAHGLRGPWPPRERHPNEVRVVCIGDSCTFGSGVRLDQTYGYRLEDELQQQLPGRRVSTTLLALPGYSTFQDRLLVDRHAEDLRPDVSVLYCGAWNDFAPARRLRDSQRGTSLRLARLLDPVLDGGAPGVEAREALRESLAPDGRRVEPEEFRENLRAMIERLRRVGSRVLLVVPPAPATTLRRYPIGESYRAVLREIAGASDVELLDGQALFDSFVESVPEGWREVELGRSLVFRDWIHPTALGHELLARALLERLQPELSRWRAGTTEEIEDPRAGEPEPRVLTAGRSATVSLALSAPASIARVWLGKRVIDRFEPGPGELRFAVPDDLPPGDHPIRIATASRWHDTGRTLTVDAPPIEAALVRDGGTAELRADVQGPPDVAVVLWIARARRPEPVATRYGSFGLPDEGASPPGRADVPFNFRTLRLASFHARSDGDGVARFRKAFAIPDGADALYVQALLREGGRNAPGLLTRVVRVSIPR